VIVEGAIGTDDVASVAQAAASEIDSSGLGN
jgi:hypothetical protein